MATTDKTPLWLDLKKEYIDDNFDKLKCRFYIGLASHIQILEGEPLKQYAKDYAEKYL